MLTLLLQRSLHRRKAVTRVSLACRAGWKAAGTFGERWFDLLMCVSVARLLARRLCFPPLPLRTDACAAQPRQKRRAVLLLLLRMSDRAEVSMQIPPPFYLSLSLSISLCPLSSSLHLLSVTTPPSTAPPASLSGTHGVFCSIAPGAGYGNAAAG